jgi:hypothetical protein
LPSSSGVAARNGSLGRGTLDTLMAVADALFSTERGSPPAERIAFLRHELSDFMARSTRTGRALFTLAALAMSIVAPLSIGKMPPLRRLSLSDRVRALQRFEASTLAPLLLAVRALMCLIYYEHPDALRELGVDSAGPAEGKLYTPEPHP